MDKNTQSPCGCCQLPVDLDNAITCATCSTILHSSCQCPFCESTEPMEVEDNDGIYTIVYGPTWWECMVKVDHGHIFKNVKPGEDWTMEQAMKEMILFWTGGKERLDLNEGDITLTWLQQLGREICYIQGEQHCNLTGVLAAFKSREGWWPMDGSNGITILEVDDHTIPHREFEVIAGTQGRRTRGHE